MGTLDIFFPRKCFGCQVTGFYLCPECVKKAELVPPRKRRNYISIWKYKGNIRKAIIGMKYKFASEIAKELAGYAVKDLKKRKFPKNLVLVPIPLHWRRKNWRGFNQSEEMGKIIAKEMGWDFDRNLLRRKASTKPQVKFKGIEREENIKNAFKLTKPLSKEKTILLFDDVLTTGSTVREAIRVIKDGEGKEVWVLTLAS
ncbi:MAG: ComF family protein [Patescibacteria group bacterium]